MKNGINSQQLKWIALTTMIMDHFGASIYLYWLIFNQGINPFYISDTSSLTIIYWLLRTIGRIAFPIYAYLLVQGFQHTKNKIKYALSLLFFALISESFFDAISPYSSTQSSNVFFTLFLALILLQCIQFIQQQKYQLLSILIGVCTIYLAIHFNTDYSWIGLLLISGIYLFKNNLKLTSLYMIGWGLFEFPLLSASIPGLLILFYNKKKGETRLPKYFFYAIYPIHLALFSYIVHLIITQR